MKFIVQKSFIGRKEELEKLQGLYCKAMSSLVLVRGRRRIGKSRLIAEFAASLPQNIFWSFAGLAPQEGMTAQGQRDHFARQLATFLKVPPLTFQDWSDAFEHLSLHLQDGDIVLFDEISWMGAKDPSFIPKLKAWWDKQHCKVMLIVCGSVSTWIEDNILKSTAFFGRVNLIITLAPLSISESAQLLRVMGFQGSSYEFYQLLSVLGGIPWYLEQVTSGITAEQTIKRLCFEKDGLLVSEFDRIFHDLFNGTGTVYKRILNLLKEGMKTLAEIRQALEFSRSGTLSQLMENLIVAGFVEKQQLWSFKTAKPLKQSLYRLADPYMRFYLKVIEKHRAQIDVDAFDTIALSHLPGFESHMGFQVETLLLQNRALILKAIGVCGGDLMGDGPYRQSHTTKTKGCQIDYLVQTLTKNLFINEFKFKRRELGEEVIESMKEKIHALKIPRGYAAVPVLFHIGGVVGSVATSGYFYRIIDISNFLNFDIITV